MKVIEKAHTVRKVTPPIINIFVRGEFLGGPCCEKGISFFMASLELEDGTEEEEDEDKEEEEEEEEEEVLVFKELSTALN